MLKEYWDIVARSQERLIQNKGVKSVSMSNKINRRNKHKRKQAAWEFKIAYHLSRDAQS